jgi:hypothetical protein
MSNILRDTFVKVFGSKFCSHVHTATTEDINTKTTKATTTTTTTTTTTF